MYNIGNKSKGAVMKKTVKEFFAKEKIEYYSVLDYSFCRENKKYLLERENLEAKSVILFLVPYYTGESENLSRYATSYDYHIFIKDITCRLCRTLGEKFPEYKFIGYGDHSPIDERSAALLAGLGILGDNGLLINEKYGSYVFIVDVISDAPPEILGAKAPSEIKKCIGCGACRRACPTGILSGCGDDCLSAITQRKGELSDSEIELMKKYNTVWGCDECQSSCPYNKNPEMTPIPFFYENNIKKLDRKTLDEMDENEFSKRAFAWRGRKTVERNIDAVYGKGLPYLGRNK